MMPFLLFRDSSAFPGLMFDRGPTRHPSLDDIRGYGRRGGAGKGRDPAGVQIPAINITPSNSRQNLTSKLIKSPQYLTVPTLVFVLGFGGFSDGNESSTAVAAPAAAVTGRGGGGHADLKLPPISRQQRDAALDFTKCLHPQSRICENLKYSLHQLRIRQQQQIYQALVDAVVFGPAEVDSVDVEEVS